MGPHPTQPEDLSSSHTPSPSRTARARSPHKGPPPDSRLVPMPPARSGCPPSSGPDFPSPPRPTTDSATSPGPVLGTRGPAGKGSEHGPAHLPQLPAPPPAQPLAGSGQAGAGPRPHASCGAGQPARARGARHTAAVAQSCLDPGLWLRVTMGPRLLPGQGQLIVNQLARGPGLSMAFSRAVSQGALGCWRHPEARPAGMGAALEGRQPGAQRPSTPASGFHRAERLSGPRGGAGGEGCPGPTQGRTSDPHRAAGQPGQTAPTEAGACHPPGCRVPKRPLQQTAGPPTAPREERPRRGPHRCPVPGPLLSELGCPLSHGPHTWLRIQVGVRPENASQDPTRPRMPACLCHSLPPAPSPLACPACLSPSRKLSGEGVPGRPSQSRTARLLCSPQGRKPWPVWG